jgi:hypothetical protein
MVICMLADHLAIRHYERSGHAAGRNQLSAPTQHPWLIKPRNGIGE